MYVIIFMEIDTIWETPNCEDTLFTSYEDCVEFLKETRKCKPTMVNGVECWTNNEENYWIKEVTCR